MSTTFHRLRAQALMGALTTALFSSAFAVEPPRFEEAANPLSPQSASEATAADPTQAHPAFHREAADPAKSFINAAINFANFEASLRADLDHRIPNTEVYQVAVHRNGGFIGAFAKGSTRVMPGVWVPATPNTPTNIGSAIKPASAVVLLRAFESRKERTVEQWLNTPMHSYLPLQYRRVINNNLHNPDIANIRRITFRDLLNHRSGWRQRPGQNLILRFWQGVKTEDMGVYSYQNWNYTLLTLLTPAVAHPQWAQQVNMVLDVEWQPWINQAYWSNPAILPSDRRVHEYYGNALAQLTRDAFLTSSTPQLLRLSCDPKVDFGLSMIHDNAQQGHSFWSEKQERGGCGAQGGWYVGPQQYSTFLGSLKRPNHAVLGASARAALFAPGNALSFSEYKPGWLSSVYGPGTTALYHGGGQGGYHTQSYVMPDGMVVVFSTNTASMTGTELRAAVRKAIQASVGG